ncbi:phosphonate utilization transcriptional regulator PhnR [Marinomonas mediterranea]|uniref:Transcriptional regulator, GntR family with UTRA sensor domain n=1 Tax=Marinomonas mediterranea (strain ATCC 700492 / JCM 21426 / NBRC 103028 / MMB-1) TaxID=717774 RepID=F2JXY2_MARM1|nr:phosphonate utilization transcriptional regulator PhnR [Marinomonas mediterranea]ADZ89631.1 transcriptional regulator, GntR family with UTRA sensor domain [Marinomonas mediterranea MMB-1]WCN07722.1 phosphonate utilization transcriptional regulator PhnR [Marinomonas mediterranea]WCN11823.1 phosphonate utilization transcriptional regulator PhnR [Marinomonas mediterranea]WCN15871.1 phosphonate utilization transcriptional regulator PhnR [Marinomonas mediterranea MMB-1]
MADTHYRHIQEHFSYLIRKNVLQAGGKLPSEREIGEQFNLTRVTVRQALQNLEAEGLIYRENRKGWFVTPPAVTYNPAAQLSFNLYVSEQGFAPSTEKIEQVVEPASLKIAQKMGIKKGSPVLFLHRRRFIDKRPVLIERMYINIAYLPGIEDEDLTQSLSQLLKNKYDLCYRDMDLSFKSTSLPEEAAKDLGIASGQPGLHVERVNYINGNQVLELDYEFWRHDAVNIAIEVRE